MTNGGDLPGIDMIDLEQKLTGYRDFICAWLYRSDSLVFLVDPGPRYSIDMLIEQLRKKGVERLDYILLTHIHVDHAGGTGRLLEIYPDAEVICHHKGIEHMIDPEKLWKGSLKVLGPVAEAYGEIYPVPADRITFRETIEVGDQRIDVIQTPGHAVHHLSYRMDKILFAGEVAGVHQAVNGAHYARPATPPRFKLEISLESLDRVIGTEPEVICFGHHGYRKDAVAAMEKAREQLQVWTETVREELAAGEKRLNDRVVERLKKTDPAFALFDRLPEDIRQREDYFIGNSLAGMRQYVENPG